ncbi:hypothetical protein [Xanthomonas fragariae]|uniref:hypothetical protein n=1 Tax=Xanthomonas fragariae TaxID=48664 RepID=UPI001ABEE19A|nr:hypothetical protein [Xanthomonas fragariae]
MRSAPGSGSGIFPARNSASIPLPFALQYDDLPPNSDVHHSLPWRADAPEPHWATVQQPASEDPVVHAERQAPVDRPSTSCNKHLFAKLSDKIRHGTGRSCSEGVYPADRKLIARFVDGAVGLEKNFDTVEKYTNLLMNFSDWLRRQNKRGLQERLFKDELTRDASTLLNGSKSNRLNAALKHLRAVESTTHGTLKIRGFCRHQAPEGDEQLINRALSAYSDYASTLRAFSAWLDATGKAPLCAPNRLHSKTLMDEARAFAKTGVSTSKSSVRALRQLQTFDRTGTTAIVKKLNTREIPEVDHQLSEQFKAALVASGRDKKYAGGRSYAYHMSVFVRSFSAWLQENNKAPLALRLHDRTLDDDLVPYLDSKSASYRKFIVGRLKQLREIFPPDLQSPALGSSAEPSGSSYSSLLSPTPPDGLPQAPENVLTPDTPEEEMAGPSLPAQPEASSPISEFDWDAMDEVDGLQPPPQSSWTLETLADELMAPSWSEQPGASSSTFPFDSDAVHQAGGLPQASQSSWTLETLADELMAPSWSEQPGASSSTFPFDSDAVHQAGDLPQAPQSSWTLETLADELMAPSWSEQPGASSSTFPFDSDAVHQAGGLPQAPQSSWTLETLADELMAPSWSAQPGASSSTFPFDSDAVHQAADLPQAPQSSWTLETLADELMAPSWSEQPGASSSTFPFDSDAVHQAGGLPQAPQSSWTLETLADELMAPSWSAQPGASSSTFPFDSDAVHQAGGLPQAHESSWDLKKLVEEEMGLSGLAQSGASISNFAFDWNALHPENAVPHCNTAMQQASLPTFDEDDS